MTSQSTPREKPSETKDKEKRYKNKVGHENKNIVCVRFRMKTDRKKNNSRATLYGGKEKTISFLIRLMNMSAGGYVCVFAYGDHDVPRVFATAAAPAVVYR